MTAEEYNNGIAHWADDAYRFARRCCSDEERCKDAVQDAFASLWERRRQVENTKGKAFLLSSVHNRLASLFRHDHVVTNASPPQEDQTPPDETFDLREAIEKALATLPQTQRECLQLRDVEGYSYKEIGSILQLTDQQVQVYIFRARVALQKKLKEFRP